MQKELWHNEALLLLDLVIGGSIEGQPAAAPPSSPTPLTWYRVATDASGDWTGHDEELGIWTLSGWRFLVPFDGLALRNRGSGTRMLFSDGEWTDGAERVREVLIDGQKVLGARREAIALPIGGATADNEARAAISGIIEAMRSHGLIA